MRRDHELTYQYTNFGVPGLGLKRGLGAEHRHRALCDRSSRRSSCRARRRENLERLKAIGALGRYGYLRRRRLHAAARAGRRRPRGGAATIMAHHSGHVDRGGRQRHLRRPHARPLPQRSGDRGGRTAAAGKGAARHPGRDRPHRGRRARQAADDDRAEPGHAARSLNPARALRVDQPDVQRPLFGDGDGDRLRLQPLERPGRHPLAGRSDRRPARHLSSSCATPRPATGGRRQPSRGRRRTNTARRCFRDDKASFIKTVGTLAREVECIVVSEGNGEAAASPSSTTGRPTGIIEVTSFAELVLAPEATDNAHPAFSKMFVETEIAPTRRRHLRAAAQARAERARHRGWRISSPIRPASARDAEAETDRRAFIGRGRTHRRCRRLRSRRHACGQPRLHARSDRGAAPPRARAGQQEGLADLLDRRRRRTATRSRRRSAGSTIRRASQRQAMLAWTRIQVQTRHVGLSLADAANVQKLARYLIYPDPFLRAAGRTRSRPGSAASRRSGR